MKGSNPPPISNPYLASPTEMMKESRQPSHNCHESSLHQSMQPWDQLMYRMKFQFAFFMDNATFRLLNEQYIQGLVGYVASPTKLCEQNLSSMHVCMIFVL